MCIRQQSQPRSATKPASSGSWRKAVTSLTKRGARVDGRLGHGELRGVDADLRARAAQGVHDGDDAAQLLVDRRPDRRAGRVDSPPTSTMSAPSRTSMRACSTARSKANHSPPSENESGVTLRMPMMRASIGPRILGPPPLNRPGAGPMTPAMAIQGTWLCPTPLHRARLLDMEAKLARPRAIMYGSLAIVFVIAIPWVGWLPFLPLVGAILGYSVLRPWIGTSARPEYVVAATVINAQVLIGASIALTGGPQSPAIAVILLPLVTLPARFSTRGVHVGLAITVAVLLAATVGADPAGFADDPTFTLIGVAAAVGLTAFAQFLMDAEMQQRSESALDPLTGLLNRTSLPARFAEIAEQAALAGDPVCVVVCDLDGFKAVNDEHGHERGDASCATPPCCCAGSCARSSSSTASAARSSCSCSPGSPWPRAATWPSAPAPPSRTSGPAASRSPPRWASPPPTATDVAYQPLFRAADAALYEAKRSGRNRVVVVGDEGEVRIAGAPARRRAA